jgi:hypothetical protein
MGKGNSKEEKGEDEGKNNEETVGWKDGIGSLLKASFGRQDGIGWEENGKRRSRRMGRWKGRKETNNRKWAKDTFICPHRVHSRQPGKGEGEGLLALTPPLLLLREPIRGRSDPLLMGEWESRLRGSEGSLSGIESTAEREGGPRDPEIDWARPAERHERNPLEFYEEVLSHEPRSEASSYGVLASEQALHSFGIYRNSEGSKEVGEQTDTANPMGQLQ